MLYIRQVRVQVPGTTNQHITHLKCSGGTGGALTAVKREVIVSVIDSGYAFSTHNDATGAQAQVVTRTSSDGRRYLTTVAGGRETNNLLDLPRF
jgi:ethanolamine utilization microcompartment shell protein EutL